MINQLLARLQQAGLELMDEDIADSLWLAMQMTSTVPPVQPLPMEQPLRHSPKASEPKRNSPTNGHSTNVSTDDQKPPTGAETPPDLDAVLPPDPARGVEDSLASPSDEEASSEGLPFRAPATTALQNALAVGRALRPLMRKVPSQIRYVLDEEATVSQIAERDVWLPVLKPDRERWLDLELIIEESRSSFIWQDAVDEFQQLLKCQGAFRNVRVWRLKASGDGDPLLVPYEQTRKSYLRPRGHRELLHASKRGLILLVSDCTSTLWIQARLHRWLQDWSQHEPTALIQLVPERLWGSSELGLGSRVQIKALAPGIANPKLVLDSLAVWERDSIDWTKTLLLPVVALESRPLKQWARMVSGAGNAQVSGVLFDLDFVEQQAAQGIPAQGLHDNVEPEELVDRFLATASPIAQQLAGLMAAAPVSLPVVHLIQKKLLPGSTPVHVAEVFLSGMVQRTSTAQELAQYDFVGNTRKLLNLAMRWDKTRQVLDAVSEYVAEKLGKSIKSFDALLLEQQDWSEPNREKVLPFAHVTLDVLRNLGGDFAAFADEVEVSYRLKRRQRPEKTESSAGYTRYADLRRNEQEDKDYRIRLERRIQPRLVALNQRQRQLLREALTQVFFTQTAFTNEIFLSDALGAAVPLLPRNNPLSSRSGIHDLIHFAEERGRISELIDATYRVDPGNSSLQALLTEWDASNRDLPSIALVAIHGGKIEPGTTEIAEAIAENRYSFYTFEGMKPSNNFSLHIPSHLFDEPRALELVSQVDIVVAIHGCRGDGEFIRLGGRDESLKERTREQLRIAEFQVDEDSPEGLRGTHAEHICNRGRSGKGVQVELSRGLRDRLFNPNGDVIDTGRFQALIGALQQSLDIRPAEAQEREPDFPPLQTLTFETGQLVEEPDTDTPPFPPLQTETFDVVTIEIEEPTTTTPIPEVELVPFTFEVAILERDSQSRQWTTQRQQQQAQGYREPLAKNVLIDMVAIPGGRFVMGSPKDEPKRSNRENPQHDVTVPAFFMGRYPITQAQWRAVAAMPAIEQDLKPDPSRFKGDPRRPVERINWYEAVEFCNRLAAHTGRPYRLPSEAEWEYACRAGTTTPFHFGRTMMATLANYQGTVLYSNEPVGENRKKTTPVGYFGVANAFGLSDMHGNVREWCLDLWHSNYNGAPTDGSAWIEARLISERVVRGGSWSAEPRFCRSASREGHGVVIRSNIGLRVVWSPP